MGAGRRTQRYQSQQRAPGQRAEGKTERFRAGEVVRSRDEPSDDEGGRNFRVLGTGADENGEGVDDVRRVRVRGVCLRGDLREETGQPAGGGASAIGPGFAVVEERGDYRGGGGGDAWRRRRGSGGGRESLDAGAALLAPGRGGSAEYARD